MQNVVLLFPGQGSQTPGMGADLAARHPVAHEILLAADAAIGAPLSALCFGGPAEDLTLTHNAQPALLAHGAALWSVLRDVIGDRVVAAAGHSLGEFTAYHAADAIAFPEAIRLVRTRGLLMLASGEERPGAMAALLGELSEPIEDICARATEDAGLVVPANFNSPGQIVVSGTVDGVERAMGYAKAAGAKRAIRLKVSGAFHSPLMAESAAGLEAALELAHVADPRFPIYTNVTAQPVKDAALARRLLLQQLTSPVQWIRLIEALATRHPDALYLELGPGTVLAGLVKKIAPQLTVASVGTASDVDAFLSRVTA